MVRDMELEKYVNHLGTELLLREFPIMVQTENLFDYEWTYDNRVIGNRSSEITRFYRNLSENDISIVIHGRNVRRTRKHYTG